jgi:hypothetical protein
MARRLLLLWAMRLSISMKVAAIALAGLMAWGTSLAHADEAPDSEPSVTVLTPGPTAPPRPAAPSPPPATTGTPASGDASAVAPAPPKARPVLVPVPRPAAASPSESGVAVSRGLPRSRPSLAAVPATAAASPEIGLGIAQVFIGSFATFGTFLLVALVSAGANSAPVAVVGLLATPAVGGLVVCRMGRSSKQYEGDCGAAIGGSYLGALTLGIALAYVGAKEFAPSNSDGGNDAAVGAALGAALGLIVGTAVGATIAWHASKHPREPSVALAFGPPPPPPAALASWSDLQARPNAARAPTAVGVPLLSLRF